VTPALDHLVVIAATLNDGVAWCEATLGVTPGPGGEHPLMGTHNRLIKVATATFPSAYLEVIAINPGATPARAARARRWFDMDNEALQARLRQTGPQLAHWVAQVPDITQAVATLAAQGIDRGRVLAASRPIPQGLLAWQISVRNGGQRLFDGCLPTLIEWGSTHPTQTMPDSGVTLQSLHLQHPDAAALRAACEAVGLQGIPTTPGPAQIQIQLATPRGLVNLQS
jgi:hypothetical protein